MSELKENQLTVIDENGNETLCQILFTFESETTGKKFVVFYPLANLEDDDDQIELSAAMYTEGADGNGELHEITEESDWEEVENAIEESKLFSPTIIIMDEVHRMNKDKQDLLLPVLESGLITLIGMTTSNPYHSINPAIRSRCQLFELKELTVNNII